MSAKEKALKDFTERVNNGQSIRYNDLQREDPSLIGRIYRHFGGILGIAKEIGISEEDLIKKYGLTRNINKRTLSESEIRNRLLYLKSIGKLTTNAMRNEFDDLRLELSIKKIYESVDKGLKYFDLERDITRITKKGIIEEIRRLSSLGIDLSYKNAVSVDVKLVSNAVSKFKKSWHGILDELRVDYKSKYKRLTKENVSKRIEAIIEREGFINYSLMQQYDSSLIYYIYENFDSIVDFYLYHGIDPNTCMDFSKQNAKGFEFERVFRKLLDTLKIEYVFNKSPEGNTGIRPDFQLNKGVWIDCKLSSWTSTIDETIEKYTPFCKKLIIVFLRGEYHHLPENSSSKIEFRKIDYYYPYLYEINRHDLIEEFEDILNNDYFSESVTTERLIS